MGISVLISSVPRARLNLIDFGKERECTTIEAKMLGSDHRYVVTKIKTGSAEWLDDGLYSTWEQAENSSP